MYHSPTTPHNARPVMYQVALRVTASVTTNSLTYALEKICDVQPSQAGLWAELLSMGSFQFGCFTKDVAESTVAKIEYGARIHNCPLHATIEPIRLKTT